MTTLTQVTPPILQYPVKFLGATLLSMNTNVGWGVDTSTLNVELIEDCVVPQDKYDTLTETIITYTEPDLFIGKNNEIIGSAAYFSLPAPDPNEPWNKFRFGGIISNWQVKETNGGITYTVSLTDPKPLLENTIIITDSYSDLPYSHYNYYNVYAAYEASVLYGNTSVFGNAQSSERGMVYNSILRGLLALGYSAGDLYGRPTIYSNTAPNITIPGGGRFKVDLGILLTNYPSNINTDYAWHTASVYTNPNRYISPDGSPIAPYMLDSLPIATNDYRITGPLSLLDLINQISELTGRNFYTNLVYDPQAQEHIIRVSSVQLLQQSSYSNIISSFQGVATDLSYGKELRSDKTRKMVMGDSVHYLSSTSDFIPFFGETNDGTPIIPLMDAKGNFINPFTMGESNCGFWIKINASTLNETLSHPLWDPSVVQDPENPTIIDEFWISETDLRASEGGSEMFILRMTNLGINDAYNSETEEFDVSPDNSYKSLMNAIHQTSFYTSGCTNLTKSINDLFTNFQPGESDSEPYPLNDMLLNAGITSTYKYNNSYASNMDKIHHFVEDLAKTYYGKQFLARINEPIAMKRSDVEIGEYGFGERIYSSVPTNAGGWVDYGVPVLGLTDPNLSTFRTDDDRVGCFARFNQPDNLDTGNSILSPNSYLENEIQNPELDNFITPPPSE